MPKHRLLAILGIFKIDAITKQMFPQTVQREPVMEEAHHRERVEKLRFTLINQIGAVGIENDAITFQHIHHLQEMVGGIGQQRPIRQQPGDQFLEIGQGCGRSLSHGHQANAPVIDVVASWLRPVVAASLSPTSRWGASPSTSTAKESTIAGI